MPKVIFISFNGQQQEAEAAAGHSAMEAAIWNDVPGIDADCGGAAACGTCHVYVDPEWLAKTGGPASDIEIAMLENSDGRQENSRLSCQIKLTPELDGLVLRLPHGQH